MILSAKKKQTDISVGKHLDFKMYTETRQIQDIDIYKMIIIFSYITKFYVLKLLLKRKTINVK